MITVLKFGGTSVGSPNAIRSVIRQVKERVLGGEKLVVVVSAYSGVTNQLVAACSRGVEGPNAFTEELQQIRDKHIQYAQELLSPAQQGSALVEISLMLNELEDLLRGISLVGEAAPRVRDHAMAFGERLSAYTIAHACREQGVPAQFVDAREIIRTDRNFGSARLDKELSYSLIRRRLQSIEEVPIVTGFISATDNGETTTTLGRGGSDYTAAILGAALRANAIEIWTDVSGMMTADPRKVPGAFPIEQVSYAEALELCHFGAKVIYPPTLAPAMELQIPIRVLNTFAPTDHGTLIVQKPNACEHVVTGISSIDQVSLILLQGSALPGVAGTAARLFNALAKSTVNIILISQASSEHSICFAVAPSEAERAVQAVKSEFHWEIQAGFVEQPRQESDLAVVSIVGENMRRMPGVAGRLFATLGHNGVNVVAIAQGSSELNISVVLQRNDETKALRALHDAFFLSELRTAYVALVGVGLIGGTLVHQLEAHARSLREDLHIDLRLVAVANSRQMLIDDGGISFCEAIGRLKQEGERVNISALLAALRNRRLPNVVFVDCTSSQEIAGLYEKVLESNFSLITPNKKAQSGSYEQYAKLKTLARKKGVEWIFETSVGAALPVITTLQDLLRSGDRVLRIEGVLSGTLSFIFNRLSEKNGARFSEIVREARQLGLTEPDPRDDLNCLDAGRKGVILAREAGWKVALEDVSIEPLLSKDLFALPSSDEFFNRLASADDEWEKRRSEAYQKGMRLCCVVKIEQGKVAIVIQEIGPTHPFFNLSGSDNMIAFTTERYRERPLVVRGPGAGAEVTAAGVFADIIRCANRI